MHKRGFSLIELSVVVMLLVILSYLALANYQRAQSNSKLGRLSQELSGIAKSVDEYVQDNTLTYPAHTDPYPTDVNRGVPPGLEKYLAGGTWPVSVWPHGVFDWDNWGSPVDGTQVYQISYRLCGLSDPASYCQDSVLFPTFTQHSSIYYCIQGTCVAHQSYPNDPAYCVNCAVKKRNY